MSLGWLSSENHMSMLLSFILGRLLGYCPFVVVVVAVAVVVAVGHYIGKMRGA